MKGLSLGALCLAATVACAKLPIGVSETGALLNRTVVPLVLRGAIEPGGHEKTFNGTLQEIDSQIRSINPDFSWNQFQPSEESNNEYGHVLPRQNTVKVLCFVQNLWPANKTLIEEVRDWLKDLSTALPVSAQSCVEISCQEGVAVWHCNDNLEWIQTNSYNIASAIDAILADPDCTIAGRDNLVQGQAFDKANYNVIVNQDDACDGHGN
ncbi:hypothetical protein M426DRAFT_266765 [Hypoxylon sp. CI-4A]|nr:hypothetical protein M426DRAFT_266765 [Hypoxylon sp. CI-4A]